MNDKYQVQWEALGAADPYWAVLTDPKSKGGKWDKVTFFRTGEDEINHVLAYLSHFKINIHFGTALDFGCGVGRLSRALSMHFKHVIGIDISTSMLVEARNENSQFKNIEFVHNTAEDLKKIADGSIDLVYTNMVLQHMPRRRQRLFIQEFCRVLGRGGVLVFQTPSCPNLKVMQGWAHAFLSNRILNFARKIIYGRNGVMEVHTLRKDDVLEILDREGMSIAHVERFDAAGRSFVSFRYFAIKR